MRPIGHPGQHLRSLGQHPIHGQGHLCKGYPSPQTLPRPIGGPISTHLISRCEGVEMLRWDWGQWRGRARVGELNRADAHANLQT